MLVTVSGAVPVATFEVSVLATTAPAVFRLPALALPVTAREVNVPTDVMFGCAAVVTVPAVVALVAAPVNAPTNVVEVTLVKPATVVVVLPNASVVLPNITFEFANLACARVPELILLALSAVNALPLPVNTPVLAVILTPVIVPLTPRPVSVPTDVMFG